MNSPVSSERFIGSGNPSFFRISDFGFRIFIMSSRYFDPEGLARINNMDLVARQVVEGFLTGRHRSPYHGFSVEYLDHRSYTPSDELRTIDWKILARTDK